MRIVLYAAILSLLFFAPVKGLEIDKLEPVQTVAVRMDNGAVVLETDTGNRGIGETVTLALEDMKAHTPGVIYLDTAEYLLIAECAETAAEALRAYLSANVRVGKWDGIGDVALAEKYLNIRSDLPKLKDWKMQE